MLVVAALLTSSESAPSMDIVLAVPLEDVLYRLPVGAAASSGCGCAEAGAAGARGCLRRLLALMLKEAMLLLQAFSVGLLTASLLACTTPGYPEAMIVSQS